MTLKNNYSNVQINSYWMAILHHLNQLIGLLKAGLLGSPDAMEIETMSTHHTRRRSGGDLLMAIGPTAGSRPERRR